MPKGQENGTAPTQDAGGAVPPNTQAAGDQAGGAGGQAGDLAGVIDSTVQQEAGRVRGEVDAVRQSVTGLETRQGEVVQSIQTLREALDDIRGRLSQTPVGGGGNGPHVIQGGLTSEAEARGYRFAAATALARAGGPNSTAANRSEFKYEIDVHNRLAEMYGGMERANEDSLLVPFGAELMFAENQEFAEEIYATTRNSLRHYSPGMMSREGRRIGGRVGYSLSEFDDSELGMWLREGRAGEMIDLVRAREAFSRLQATQLTLPANGRLPLPVEGPDPKSYWVGQNQPIPETTLGGTRARHLIAKKLATILRLPNELTRNGGPAIEAYIRGKIALEQALMADRTFLNGAGGTYVPLGLLGYDGINRLDASTQGANGDRIEPIDLSRAMVTIEEKDYPLDTFGGDFGWLMRPSLQHDILNRRTAAVASGDGEGEFLFRANREDISRGQETRFLGFPSVGTTQVPNDRAKGAASNLTMLIAGCWSNFVIARAGFLEFTTSTEADGAFKNDQTLVRAIQHMDAAPVREDCFVVIDNLVQDLLA